MPSIKDYFNLIGKTPLGPTVAPYAGAYDAVSNLFQGKKQTLPNGGGTYSSPVVAPTNPAGAPIQKPSKLSPDELAYTANAINQAMTGAGDIPAYVGGAYSNPNPGTKELISQSTDLNNRRNDIVAGAEDPYNWASKSGIPYKANELNAIESATGGIYDPALKDAAARLVHSQKMDEIAASKAAAAGSGTASDAEAQAWADQIALGKATLANVPSKIRSSVILAMNGNKAKNAMNNGNLSDYQTVTELLDNSALSRISGPLDQYIGGKFGKAATAKNQYEQLSSILALGKRGLLKGSGAVSDFESRQLKEASTALGRNLSDKEFRKQLLKVQGVLATSSGIPTSVRMTDPKTGESSILMSDTEGINDAIRDGLRVEYVAADTTE